MITPRFLNSIAIIGSLKYQQRWCVHGTADEYLLLDEFLDTTMFAVKQYADHSNRVTLNEKTALLRLYDSAEQLLSSIPFDDPEVSIEEIVENCEAMIQLRQAANECLRELGVSITVEELP